MRHPRLVIQPRCRGSRTFDHPGTQVLQDVEKHTPIHARILARRWLVHSAGSEISVPRGKESSLERMTTAWEWGASRTAIHGADG